MLLSKIVLTFTLVIHYLNGLCTSVKHMASVVIIPKRCIVDDTSVRFTSVLDNGEITATSSSYERETLFDSLFVVFHNSFTDLMVNIGQKRLYNPFVPCRYTSVWLQFGCALEWSLSWQR